MRFIPRTTDPEIIYGFAVVGDAGRVTDRAVLSALGWLPGTRLTVSCPEDRLTLVREATDGSVQATRAGFFRVPVRKHRRVGLLSGTAAATWTDTGGLIAIGSGTRGVGIVTVGSTNAINQTTRGYAIDSWTAQDL
ncbi:hypothetical protein [Nocardia sp. XZ_19_231]|uniref:hypothetical protein n=1 Tax=Nocardia sp. XZ_19_231 TaxID=2769252 RepID=UPI0018900B7D|nr:hypothetical protein [Nocardia sp. XZ_19_231]